MTTFKTMKDRHSPSPFPGVALMKKLSTIGTVMFRLPVMFTLLISLSFVCPVICDAQYAEAGNVFGPNWANEMFSQQRHDFGFVARGAETKQRVTIKNIYKQPVHISNIRTSCGCTAGAVNKNTIPSLETAELEITIDTKRFLGEKNTTVFVTFDSPMYAEVQFPIHVYIRSDIVLTPGLADFGRIPVGAGAAKDITIEYAGRPDWAITGIENNNSNVTADFKQLARQGQGATYQLSIAVAPDAPIGTIRNQIFLKTNDVKSPLVPVMIEATVEPDIIVTPAVVDLGMLRPGQQKQAPSVVIRGKKPFVIEKVECDSDRQLFMFKPSEGEKLVHVLQLTVNAPGESGNLAEDFTITVAGRNEPISFRATGKVVSN